MTQTLHQNNHNPGMSSSQCVCPHKKTICHLTCMTFYVIVHMCHIKFDKFNIIEKKHDNGFKATTKYIINVLSNIHCRARNVFLLWVVSLHMRHL
jgi:hypothetical protein